MKLSEILREQAEEYVVYKVTGPYTDKVYFGYSSFDNVGAIKKDFLEHAALEEDRGVARMVAANDGDVETLDVEIIYDGLDRSTAHIERNHLRDVNKGISVTQASHWPGEVHRAAMQQYPELHKQKQQMAKAYHPNASVTDAMQIGRPNFTMDKLQALAMEYGREQVLKDKEKLSANEFATKYKL